MTLFHESCGSMQIWGLNHLNSSRDEFFGQDLYRIYLTTLTPNIYTYLLCFLFENRAKLMAFQTLRMRELRDNCLQDLQFTAHAVYLVNLV